MRGFGDRRQVGDPPEDVGILDDDRAGLAVDAGDQPLGVRLRRVSSGSAVSSWSSVNFAIVVATLT